MLPAIFSGKDSDMANTPNARPLHIIAGDIARNWANPSPHARPYIRAMHDVSSIHDAYYSDTARDVVLYFLSNAATWRGSDAKRVKDELRAMLR